jgi:hypothetical protein
MVGFRSLLAPLHRRIRGHVDEQVDDVMMPRLDQLSGQIEDVRQATVDVRRIVTDDLDASNEATVLIGRALQELREAVDALRDEVAELRVSAGGTTRT